MKNDAIHEDVNELITKIDFHYLNNKSILITGASGLLGIYFISCLKFLKAKYNIKVYAWYNNTLPDYLEDYFNFDLIRIQHDITDDSYFDQLPKFDIVIHSSGYAQPLKFVEDKIKTIKINTISTLKLLEKLNENGKFLFISSSEVYSGLKNPPHKESLIGCTNTDHPRACYIEGKKCGEVICLSYQQKKVDIKIARLAPTYGPGTKGGDRRVLNSLIQKGIIDKKIILLDKGEALRTFCYISDVIEISWKILLFGKESIYNVGGISKIKIKDLAKKIGEELNVPVVMPKKNVSLAGASKEVHLDISRIRNEFNKDNFININSGLKRTITWQKENLY
jgi:nucleoside-diphosphate-sugar epimerase